MPVQLYNMEAVQWEILEDLPLQVATTGGSSEL